VGRPAGRGARAGMVRRIDPSAAGARPWRRARRAGARRRRRRPLAACGPAPRPSPPCCLSRRASATRLAGRIQVCGARDSPEPRRGLVALAAAVDATAVDVAVMHSARRGVKPGRAAPTRRARARGPRRHVPGAATVPAAPVAACARLARPCGASCKQVVHLLPTWTQPCSHPCTPCASSPCTHDRPRAAFGRSKKLTRLCGIWHVAGGRKGAGRAHLIRRRGGGVSGGLRGWHVVGGGAGRAGAVEPGERSELRRQRQAQCRDSCCSQRTRPDVRRRRIRRPLAAPFGPGVQLVQFNCTIPTYTYTLTHRTPYTAPDCTPSAAF
jgi:hypothetical protein